MSSRRASIAALPAAQMTGRLALRRGATGQRGMGLIELIVGLGLVAICVIGMNALVVTMTRGNLSAQLNDQATHLAATKIEELQSAGYDRVPVGRTSDRWWSASTGSSVLFTRTTTVTAGGLPNLRAVTVTVSWNDRGPRQSVFSTEIGK